MKRTILLLLLAYACGGGDNETTIDSPCTVWGARPVCNDAGDCGKVAVCISTEPMCTNGPWPCLDGGVD